MAAVLNVKDVRVGIGYHGRRPRKVKREYGEFVVEEQEVFSDLIEGKILRADDVTVRVELEAEEALFYSDARMSTVECNAVTAWLARYEDATLEVFVRTLQKDIEEKEAELAQNLFSSETDLGGEERGKTLNYHLEVFEQRLKVVENAQNRVKLDGKNGHKDFASDDYCDDEDDDDDDLDDDMHERPYRKFVDGYLKEVIAEVTTERSRIEDKLVGMFRTFFPQRREDSPPPRTHVCSDSKGRTIPSKAGRGPPRPRLDDLEKCTQETQPETKMELELPTVDGVHNEFFV